MGTKLWVISKSILSSNLIINYFVWLWYFLTLVFTGFKILYKSVHNFKTEWWKQTYDDFLHLWKSQWNLQSMKKTHGKRQVSQLFLDAEKSVGTYWRKLSRPSLDLGAIKTSNSLTTSTHQGRPFVLWIVQESDFCFPFPQALFLGLPDLGNNWMPSYF